MLTSPDRYTTARLCGAALLAAFAAIMLGPDDSRHQSYAIGMSLMVLLGGWIRTQTDEVGLSGRMVTGALGCLLLAPAVGIRVSKVAEAMSATDKTAPHNAVASLPGLSSEVVQSTGPLMLGAGLALIVLAGRLGGTVVGAILGGATAAWAGQTIAMQLDNAIGAERFSDLVMLSQGLHFVGLLAVLGAMAGAVIARQGQAMRLVRRTEEIRELKRQAILKQRQEQRDAAKRAEAEAEQADADANPQGDGAAASEEPEVPEDKELTPEEKAELEAINAALYATPLLHGLDDEELETIAPSFKRLEFRDDDDLFLEGDTEASIFIVCRGEVQIWKTDGEGNRFGLARLTAGTLFGEMAVIEGRPRSASASASGAVEVIVLTNEGFDKLREAHPAITTKIQIGLIQLIAQRLRQTSEDLLQVAEGETVGPDTDAPKMARGKGGPVKAEEIGELASGARLFQALEEADMQALASTIEQVGFADMEHLVTVGSSEPAMHVVTSGRVQIWRRNKDKQKVELAILGPGDPIGEMALFEAGQRTATATAIGEVKTLRLSQKAIKKLTSGHPEVAVRLHQAFLEILSERLRNTSTQLVESSFPLPARTARPAAPEAEKLDESDELHDEEDLIDEEDLLDEEDLDEEEEEEEIIVEVTPEEADPNAHLTEAQLTRQGRMSKGLAVLATLTAYWAASPPWTGLVRTLPNPSTGIDVPQAEPGLPNAQRPMNPFGTDFAAALEGRGHQRMHSRPWPCLPDVYDRLQGYGSHPRKTETLAVSADALVLDLTPAIHDMRKRGVYRMGLTGNAEPPFGPLGEFLSWPAVQLLIDSPPRTVQWIELHARHIKKLPLLPGATMPTACALLVQPEVTVDHLYATTRSLSSVYGDPSCQQAVVLVLPDDGSTTNSHPGWRGCP